MVYLEDDWTFSSLWIWIRGAHARRRVFQGTIFIFILAQLAVMMASYGDWKGASAEEEGEGIYTLLLFCFFLLPLYSVGFLLFFFFLVFFFYLLSLGFSCVAKL